MACLNRRGSECLQFCGRAGNSSPIPWARGTKVNLSLLLLVVFLIAASLAPTRALAHGGVDDEGPQEAPIPAAMPADESRLEARSEDIELVGVAKGDKLWLYVDRYASNEPLDQVTVEVSEGQKTWSAKPEGDGIYSVAADGLDPGGDHQLMFSVTGDQVSDLLVATLKGKTASTEESATLRYLKRVALGVLILAGLWLVLKFARRAGKGSMRVVVGLSVALLFTVQVTPAWAHEDDDGPHRPTANPGKLGTRAFKLADGRVFVPKAAQNILGIRTMVASEAMVAKDVPLAGQVIADPNHSGSVQAALAGVIEAPPAGLPNLGQRVQKGLVLGFVKPTLTSVERAAQESQLVTLKKDRFLSGKQLQRLEDQLRTMNNMGVNVQVERMTAENKAFAEQQVATEKSLFHHVGLRAPISGVISRSSTFIGQVVAPGQPLFEIVDPNNLWVEALDYDSNLPAEISTARALTADGKELELVYKGQGYQLRNQAIPLQFGLKVQGTPLPIGQPVTVLVRTGERIKGMEVPSESLLGSLQGETQDQAVVWVHQSAEWFTPKRVKVQVLNSKTAVVLEGLSPGDRVVTEGASFLAQVR